MLNDNIHFVRATSSVCTYSLQEDVSLTGMKLKRLQKRYDLKIYNVSISDRIIGLNLKLWYVLTIQKNKQ